MQDAAASEDVPQPALPASFGPVEDHGPHAEQVDILAAEALLDLLEELREVSRTFALLAREVAAPGE
jgi:hypothetical protein